MDPYVDQYLIDVRVKNGVVTLSGTVGSLIEKDYATSKAYVAGITRVVDDDLHVASWAQEPMERPAKVGIVTDAEAEKAVETALKYDPRVLSYDIDVQVENGKATLAGTVDNLKAKQAASRDTLNTVGIWKVESWIKVRPGDHLTDAEIGEDVRDALAWDPIVERFDISVLVRNRRVSLTGVVDTNVEKRHAADIASRVNGVASVDNHLVVDQAWPYKSDAEIKEDIESEYAWSPFVDGGDLTIRVDDGHVDIAGTVETWHEYREAVENAFEGGAKEVNSYMRVEANDRIYDRQWSQPPSEVWPL
jgi:osmotically-inducible protein OsmY